MKHASSLGGCWSVSRNAYAIVKKPALKHLGVDEVPDGTDEMDLWLEYDFLAQFMATECPKTVYCRPDATEDYIQLLKYCFRSSCRKPSAFRKFHFLNKLDSNTLL